MEQHFFLAIIWILEETFSNCCRLVGAKLCFGECLIIFIHPEQIGVDANWCEPILTFRNCWIKCICNAGMEHILEAFHTTVKPLQNYVLASNNLHSQTMFFSSAYINGLCFYASLSTFYLMLQDILGRYSSSLPVRAANSLDDVGCYQIVGLHFGFVSSVLVFCFPDIPVFLCVCCDVQVCFSVVLVFFNVGDVMWCWRFLKGVWWCSHRVPRCCSQQFTDSMNCVRLQKRHSYLLTNWGVWKILEVCIWCTPKGWQTFIVTRRGVLLHTYWWLWIIKGYDSQARRKGASDCSSDRMTWAL